MYGNASQIAYRKSLRTVLALAALAWAAQWLLAGDARGAEAMTDAPQERFVAATPRFLGGATLELRGEATVTGGEVKLKQVCRWSDMDKAAFEPVADFVVARMGPST